MLSSDVYSTKLCAIAIELQFSITSVKVYKQIGLLIYKLSDSFSLIDIKCPYSKLLAYIHKSNFNIHHVYAYIRAYRCRS